MKKTWEKIPYPGDPYFVSLAWIFPMDSRLEPTYSHDTKAQMSDNSLKINIPQTKFLILLFLISTCVVFFSTWKFHPAVAQPKALELLMISCLLLYPVFNHIIMYQEPSRSPIPKCSSYLF